MRTRPDSLATPLGGGAMKTTALLSVLAVAGLWGCGGSDGGTTEPETPRPTSVVISPSSVSLAFLGQTANLTASVKDQNGSPITGSITWTSDDPGVATVSAAGQVMAIANGTTTVRATSGSISGSVTVTVEQVATRLTVVAGNGQSGLAGESVTEAVVVRADDAGGSPVPGVEVTFTPAEGSGSVSAASVTTDGEGLAATLWTLGSAFGPQRLDATTDGGPSAVVTATSLSPVPLADFVTNGTMSLSRGDPSTLDPVDVSTTVRNDGTTSSGQTVPVQLLADGVVIATADLPVLEPDDSATVSFTTEPFDEGSHTLRLEIDPDDVVPELNESDNDLQRDINVVLQTAIESATTLTGLSAATDVEMLYRLDLPLGANNLTVELSGGTGDVDLFLEAGERPSTREGYDDCISESPTTAERCQLSPAGAGQYHILLHAFSAFSGLTMTVSLDGEVLPYDIELVFLSNGTQRQDSAVTVAAERWMSFIKVDVPDNNFAGNPIEANACVDGQPTINDNIDDIRIFVRIDSIDGVSGTLARAGPCLVRPLSRLPVVGVMTFDEADLEQLDSQGELFSVVVHEMAHVLGLGTVWSDLDLLQNPSLPNNQGVDTYFAGPRAVAAFDAAGGTNYTQGNKVPVENQADEGSGDSHWRESVMGVELMTPFFNAGFVNPLSAITVESMGDLGYQVDSSGADDYFGAFSAARAPGAPGRIIDLSGDIIRPTLTLGPKGRVIPIPRSR